VSDRCSFFQGFKAHGEFLAHARRIHRGPGIDVSRWDIVLTFNFPTTFRITLETAPKRQCHTASHFASPRFPVLLASWPRGARKPNKNVIDASRELY
jgi:hypothetical protein